MTAPVSSLDTHRHKVARRRIIRRIVGRIDRCERLDQLEAIERIVSAATARVTDPWSGLAKPRRQPGPAASRAVFALALAALAGTTLWGLWEIVRTLGLMRGWW